MGPWRPTSGLGAMSVALYALDHLKKVVIIFITSTIVWSENEVAQSCPTLCDPMDCSLPGSSIHGIFQARILKWIAISFSRRSSQPRDWKQVSHIVGRHFTIWATREAYFSSVQLSSVTQLCPTLQPHELQHARPPCPSPTPGVHLNSHPSSRWIQPSHPLSSPSPPAPNPSQCQSLFQWVNSSH